MSIYIDFIKICFIFLVKEKLDYIKIDKLILCVLDFFGILRFLFLEFISCDRCER